MGRAISGAATVKIMAPTIAAPITQPGTEGAEELTLIPALVDVLALGYVLATAAVPGSLAAASTWAIRWRTASTAEIEVVEGEVVSNVVAE
jgi:hypothetical protein